MNPPGGESMLLAPCRPFLFKLGNLLVIVALRATLNSGAQGHFYGVILSSELSAQFMNKVATLVTIMIEYVRYASKK